VVWKRDIQDNSYLASPCAFLSLSCFYRHSCVNPPPSSLRLALGCLSGWLIVYFSLRCCAACTLRVQINFLLLIRFDDPVKAVEFPAPVDRPMNDSRSSETMVAGCLVDRDLSCIFAKNPELESKKLICTDNTHRSLTLDASFITGIVSRYGTLGDFTRPFCPF